MQRPPARRIYAGREHAREPCRHRPGGPGVKRPSTRNDYALLVGVGLYKDPEAFDDLEGPPNDCVDFREWLINDACVPPGNIEVAARSPGDQRRYPNASDVREKLAK